MELTRLGCPETSRNSIKYAESCSFMSSLYCSDCLLRGTFLVSLWWWFQYQNPILSKSLASLDFMRAQTFQVLPEGKELLLFIQKLLSVRSQTLREFFTAGLDLKLFLEQLGVNALLLISEIQWKEKAVHFMCSSPSFYCLWSTLSGL